MIFGLAGSHSFHAFILLSSPQNESFLEETPFGIVPGYQSRVDEFSTGSFSVAETHLHRVYNIIFTIVIVITFIAILSIVTIILYYCNLPG